jgi:putative nucleotidyltransferase with HDIG domain
VSRATQFLNGFAQALSAMTLYGDGHPQRERAIDVAFRDLEELQAEDPRPLFTFLGDEVVYRNLPLRELRDWDWSRRLAAVGVQRLEFVDRASREDFEGFLDEVLVRLTLGSVDTSEARQLRRTSIKFGVVGIRGGAEATPDEAVTTATLSFSLGEEAAAIRWLHDEVRDGSTLPIAEAETVVQSLAVAMHGGRQVMLPLLQLKDFDQYTTTHSLNVAVLTMALAEFMGIGAADVRACGLAGLLHDVGKIKIPRELLIKPGKLTPDERSVISQHPGFGAQLILASEEELDLAAVVAYEHHIMLNGAGYPRLRFARPCHRVSNLIHVCDVFDALRTRRPYRDAWPAEDALRYLQGRAGMEFDPDIVRPFVTMIRQWDAGVTVLTDERAPIVPRERLGDPGVVGQGMTAASEDADR